MSMITDNFTPHFWTTVLGSYPNQQEEGVCRQTVQLLDVPAWPQLPRRTFRENMYVQYSASLPGIVLDEVKEKAYFDTSGDLSGALEAFYERVLADDVEAFGLPPDYAAGFAPFLDALDETPGVDWAKGQVTGPISFGLTVTDQDLRASLYDETLADVIVKNLSMNARWQVRQLQTVRPGVVIFVDEPYLASFGSAYISLEREQVIAMLDEVIAAIHAEGALAGVHCCGNTDWSMLLATQVDILNLDAYSYLDSLALYPHELAGFLGKGGAVAWGIVPNNADIFQVTPEVITERLRAGFEQISRKAAARGVALPVETLAHRSLLTPACGLGPATLEIAERTLDTLTTSAYLLRSNL